MIKKTATVTWIKYNNYGTFLQAYALQKFLNMHNIENVILDDKNILPISENDVIIHKKNFYTCIKKLIKILYRRLKKISNKQLKNFCYIQKIREKRYIEFRKKYLNLSSPVEYDKLYELENCYDAFICGSDQIWAPKNSIFNKYYYLSFTNKTKIAYAPSIGLNKIPDDLKDKIADLVNKIDYVSVREEQGADILRKITNKDISVVLDPTLLLTDKEWDKMAFGKIVDEPYILCYFLGDKDWYRNKAKELAKKMNMKLVVLPMFEKDINLGSWEYGNCGPDGFVNLIKYANFICTDSFHGTIFSIIFNKQFITFKRFDDSDLNCQNSRIYNLLNKLKLIDNFIGEENYDDKIIEKVIDYTIPNKILLQERKKSIEFLMRSLDNK